MDAPQLHGATVFSDRVRALFFDVLATGVETAAGWKQLRSALPDLLKHAVVPALSLGAADRELWMDDEDDFIRLHIQGTVRTCRAAVVTCMSP